MSVRSIMSTPVVTVGLDDSLATVKEIFDHARFHHLLVVSHDTLRGVVSDRDLYKAISPRLGTAAATDSDRATLNKRVHQIMSRKPIAVGPSASIGEVIDHLLDDGVSCLPIVDEANHPIGIVSWRDILRALRGKRV